MYAKRIQILNYGPIEELDLALPFDGDRPKPVLLIGGNGSGKSIALSHIVNGLISAKDGVYKNSPEVEPNRVYKIRSNSYIKLGREAYFARVDFEENLFTEEMRCLRDKEEYTQIPAGLSRAPMRRKPGKGCKQEQRITCFRTSIQTMAKYRRFDKSFLRIVSFTFLQTASKSQHGLTKKI